MFQTVFHSGICVGEADLHHSLAVQITIGIFDLLNEVTQSVLSRCRRIEPDAAALNKSAAINGFRIDTLHSFNAHHISKHLLI